MTRRKTTGPKGEKKVTRYTYGEIKEPRPADRAVHVKAGLPGAEADGVRLADAHKPDQVLVEGDAELVGPGLVGGHGFGAAVVVLGAALAHGQAHPAAALVSTRTQ